MMRFMPHSRAQFVPLLVTLTALASLGVGLRVLIAEEAAPSKPKATYGGSRARTTTGHFLKEDDLKNPQYCAQCHTEIAEQWDASAHHFASLNGIFYEKTFEKFQQNRPPESAKFCGGCHDPLVFLTGNMEKTVTKETVNAQEGLTCLVCHGIVEVPDRVGNGGYVLSPPDHYPGYNSSDPKERMANLVAIRKDPTKHKATLLKPLHRTSEFCLACHKAHLDTIVNQHRWKRGQNDYDAWHDSVAGMKSALTFFNGKEMKRCQDCHMEDVPTNDPAAKDGKTRHHGFGSANSALALVNKRQAWIDQIEKTLKDCVSTDIFAIQTDNSDSTSSRIWPIQRPDARLVPGQTVRAEVLVRNRKVGHLFPGGTLDLNEAWIEFTVAKPDGSTIFISGDLDAKGRLDPNAHRFNAIILTRKGELVDIHNVDDFFTILYNNGLPLGPADAIRFEFKVPDVAEGTKLRLTARVLYRKFSRQYTEFALGPDAAAMPIVEVSRNSVDIAVGKAATLPEPAGDKDLAMRLNDFGIAHLRQGDTRTAAWAFNRVAEMIPDYPDAYLNQARALLADGAMEPMEEVLKKAEKAAPGYFRTGYFLGRLRTTQSRFADAVAAFDHTLKSFPEDREVLNSKGTALYKWEKFADAIKTFEKVLTIDPENSTAHTYLFRCYSALGDEENTKKYQASYLRYRTEEFEKTVTERYRRANPPAHREATPLHVHVLHVPGEGLAAVPVDTKLADAKK